MKISIALATYNGAQYLQEQLQSFLDQTRQPDELVITDDCSTDETETIVRDFEKTAPFDVHFYRNEKNLGYSGNFNAALNKTTGDLVFLSDQDDVWFYEKIEHMESVARKNPDALVVMNDAALTDGDLNEVGLTKIGQIRSAGLPMEVFVMGCCCAVRRELLDFCLPIPKRAKAHDTWIMNFANGLSATVIEHRPLQYYRRHESNESQFIANRTKRVNRAQAFFHVASRIFFDNEVRKKDAIHIEQLMLFTQGFRDAEVRAPSKYKTKLYELCTATESKKENQIQRMKLRDKWFLPRLFGTLRLLATGKYRHTNGIKSVFRDIVG